MTAPLADKYERMLALRARLGRGTPSQADRAALRDLARDYPGALRELDTVETAELERRLGWCRAAAPPDWVRWMAAYHDLMRQALAIRAGRAPDGDLGDDAQAPRHGRLNVLVFEALGRRFGLPAATIWDALFPRRGRAPRPYRD